jgi:hypothetical protein
VTLEQPWWVYAALALMLAVAAVVLVLAVRAHLRDPIFRCPNCGDFVGPMYRGDPRTKPEIRRDHEKRCLP